MGRRQNPPRPLTEAERELVERNVRLAYAIANRFKGRIRDPAADDDDVVATALVALCTAAQGFRPELGFKLSTYAVRTIEGALLRLVQRSRRGGPRGATVVSVDQETEDGGGRLGETIADPTENVEAAALFSAALSALPGRDRAIATLAAAGLTQQEIAQRVGVAQPNVSRRLARLRAFFR